jgi:hypothetical protein
MAALTALAWKASEQSGEVRAGCTEEDEVGDDGVEPPSDERAEVRRPLPHGGGAEAVQEEERVTWRRRGRPHVDGGGGGGSSPPDGAGSGTASGWRPALVKRWLKQRFRAAAKLRMRCTLPPDSGGIGGGRRRSRVAD